MASLKEEENRMGELYIFPLLKKYPTSKKGKKLTVEELDRFAYHYMKQLIHHLDMHGFEITPKLLRDFDLVNDAFKSTIYRTIGEKHPLQEYVDQLDLDD